MPYDDNYTRQLENIIKQMLTPLKNVPFNLVIESITGKKFCLLIFQIKNIKKYWIS